MSIREELIAAGLAVGDDERPPLASAGPVFRLDDVGRAIARKRTEAWILKGRPSFEDFEDWGERRRRTL